MHLVPMFAAISGKGLVAAFFACVMIGVIFWALWRFIRLVTMQPLNTILKIVWVVALVFVAVDVFTGYVGIFPAVYKV